MHVKFQNILIPIDFSINSRVAIARAMELADKNFAILHLLHVVKPTTTLESALRLLRLPSITQPEKDTRIAGGLQKLKETIEATDPALMAQVYTMPGNNISQVILDVSKRINPDLLIIASKGTRKFFNFKPAAFQNTIARKTGCPVLTIRSGAELSPVKNIIMPMGDFVPKRKIEWVCMLAKKYRARIHIVTMSRAGDEATAAVKKSFIETYRQLREALPTPIEFRVLSGNSFARSVLTYAQQIEADLVLVNPGYESKISTFTGQHMNDVLSANSSIQILSLEPYATELAITS